MTSTDVELLHRCVEREDRAALDELFGRHYPAVHRTVLKLVHDEFDAGDIAQATFLTAVRAGRTAPPLRSFRGWLLAIAVNEVRQFARSRRRRRTDWLHEACLEDPAGSAADAASRREFERALEDALQLLPQKLKEPLVLHYYESLPLGAVGEILELPRSTVQTRVAMAVERLRRAFRRRGHAALLPLLDLRVPLPAPVAAAGGLVAWLTTGVLSMSGKKLAVAGLALLALGFGIGALYTAAPPLAPATGTEVAAASPPPANGPAVAPPAATGTAGAIARETVPPTPAMVFGQVVDAATGAPIADATVTLFDFAAGDATTVRSGRDGCYQFAGSRGSAGLFHLVIEKAGFGRGAAFEVQASTQPRRDLLDAGLVIRGRVVEADGGRPVPAFRVLAARLPFQQQSEWNAVAALHRQAIPPALRTDAVIEVADQGGTFAVAGLAPGRYVLLIAAPGRQPLYYNGGGRSYDHDRGVEAAPAADARPVEIALPAGGHAVVEVVDRANGLPVHGARVRNQVFVGRGAFAFDDARPDRAAGNRFELPIGLDARGNLDDVDFEVTATGYAPGRWSASGQEDGHVFVADLGRPATVRGRVRDGNGEPLAAAAVLVECDNDGWLVGSAYADGDGRYEVAGLDARRAQTLRCLSPGLSAVIATVPLRLADGEVRDLDLGPGAAVTAGLHGTVSVLGVPRRGARLYLDGPAGIADVDCETRADGSFAFAGLSPGHYGLTVVTMSAGRDLRAERIVEVGATPQRLDFDFARRLSGAVSGALSDAGSGLAAALTADPDQFTVVAARLGTDGAFEQADVGEDGRFELLVAEPGIYQLSVDAAEWVTVAPVEVDLRAETARDGIRLQVAHDLGDGRIELRFVDAVSGRPVSGELHWYHARAQCAARIDDGLYVEEQAILGVYRFVATTPEHRPKRFEVVVSPSQKQVQQQIALEPAQAVKVVQVEPGGPAHRAGVRAGDLLRRYGASAIRSAAALHAAVAASTGVVTIVVERDGVELALVVDAGRLGVEVENMP